MKEKRGERTSLASQLAPSASARNDAAEPIKRQTRRLRRLFVGPFSSFSIRAPCLLSPSRRDFPRARSLPRRFPLRAKSSQPGTKSSQPGAKSSSSSDDLSSPEIFFYDFLSAVTLALESDVSPVEERDGAAASALSMFLSIRPHAARGTTKVLRTWVFPCATSFHEHHDGVCSSRPLVVRAAAAPANYAVVACA